MISGSVVSRQLREAGLNPGGAAAQHRREGVFVRQYGRGAEARVRVHIDIDEASHRFTVAAVVRQALRAKGYVYVEHRDDEYGLLYYNVEFADAQSAQQRLHTAAKAIARAQHALERGETPLDDEQWVKVWEEGYTPELRATYVEMARAARSVFLPS